MKIKIFSLTIGIIILISAFSYFIYEQYFTFSRENVLSVEVKSETIDTGIQLETEIKEADLFTTNIVYPFTKIEAIDEPIKSWVAEQENDFYEELEQISFIFAKKIKAHFSVETEIFKVKDHLFSFKLTTEQYIDENNHFTNYKTFVIDLRNKEIVSIEDVLTIDDDLKQQFTEQVRDKIYKSKLTDKSLNDQINQLNQSDWMMTKDELILYFYENYHETDKDDLILVSLKFKNIKNNLTKEYNKLLIPKKKKDKPKKSKKKGKLVALTFDDGPDDKITPQILKTLEKHNIKATFFMLANSAERFPKTAKKVAKKGHEVANHSISHVNLNKVKKKRIENEVIKSQSRIKKVTGVKPTLFRPPYGEFNQNVINYANKSDQKIILWSVDTMDWKLRNRNKIVDQIKKQTTPSSIVLMHDIHQTTADALEGTIKYLQKEGYEFVTVSDLLPEIEPKSNGVYYGN